MQNGFSSAILSPLHILLTYSEVKHLWLDVRFSFALIQFSRQDLHTVHFSVFY